MDGDGAENRGGGPGAMSAAPALDRASANRAETVTDAAKTDPTTETAAENFEKMLDPVEGVAKFEIFTASGQRIASGSAYPGELSLTNSNLPRHNEKAGSGAAVVRGKPGQQIQKNATPSFVQHILKCSVASAAQDVFYKIACGLAEKVEDKFNLPLGTLIASAGRPLLDKSSAPHEYPLFPPDEATQVSHSSMGTGSKKVEQLQYLSAHERYCSHAMLFTFCFATRRKMLVPGLSESTGKLVPAELQKYEHCSLGFQVCPLTGRISMPGIFVAATETERASSSAAASASTRTNYCRPSYENCIEDSVACVRRWRRFLVDKHMRLENFDGSEQLLQQHRSELDLLAKILQHPDTPTLVCDALGSDLREDLRWCRNVMRKHSQHWHAAHISVAEYLEALHDYDPDAKETDPLTCCEGHSSFVGHFRIRNLEGPCAASISAALSGKTINPNYKFHTILDTTTPYFRGAQLLLGGLTDLSQGGLTDLSQAHLSTDRLTFDRAGFATLFAEDGETEPELLEKNCGVATWGRLLEAVYRHRAQNQEPLSDPIQFTLFEKNTNAAATSASGAGS